MGCFSSLDGISALGEVDLLLVRSLGSDSSLVLCNQIRHVSSHIPSVPPHRSRSNRGRSTNLGQSPSDSPGLLDSEIKRLVLLVLVELS